MRSSAVKHMRDELEFSPSNYKADLSCKFRVCVLEQELAKLRLHHYDLLTSIGIFPYEAYSRSVHGNFGKYHGNDLVIPADKRRMFKDIKDRYEVLQQRLFNLLK